MAEAGRPPALDERDRNEIAAVLSTGCSIRVAADFVGCSRRTIHRELANNPEFYDQVRRLQVATLLGPLKQLQDAANTNWRAAAWLAERLNPQDFGRRHPHMVDPEDINLAAQVAMREIKELIDDPKLLRRLYRRMQRILMEGVHLKRSEKYRPRGPKTNSSKTAGAPPASLPAPEDENLDEFDDEEGLDEIEADDRIALRAEVEQIDRYEREELEEQQREREERQRSAGMPPTDQK